MTLMLAVDPADVRLTTDRKTCSHCFERMKAFLRRTPTSLPLYNENPRTPLCVFPLHAQNSGITEISARFEKGRCFPAVPFLTTLELAAAVVMAPP